MTHHHHRDLFHVHRDRVIDAEVFDADPAADLRRAAAVASRRRNLETAAFCSDPRTILTGPVEPRSAQAWSAISQAYRFLARARTADSRELRAAFIEAAGAERRRARDLRALICSRLSPESSLGAEMRAALGPKRR